VDYKYLNKTEVRGYLKPDSAFRTLDEWKLLAQTLVEVQSKGFDTRSGEISCKHASFCSKEEYDNFVMLIKEYFGFLLTSEVERWDLLTRKNVLDFIEDFVNHRVWGIEQEYGAYFTDIGKLRFSYFYSRGDIEPYVLLDEEYTRQTLGDTEVKKTLLHYTSPNGISRMQKSISAGKKFDISSFTRSQRPFFRDDSTLVIKFVGNVTAAFRSDIKSMATDTGQRACNLYRLQYPGDDMDNICRSAEDCADGAVRTDLWNEFIASPLEILKVYKAPKTSGISMSPSTS
jgi:hypothetical protein